MSSILQAQRREAANLVELMRRQGVHQALNEAILTVYMSGTNSPSDMLDEILHQMGSVRVPPVPEKVRLPLRAKDDFVYALQMSSLQSALKPGVQALDEARRGGKQLDAGEAIALVKDKAVAWQTARKAAARKRALAAQLVLEPPQAPWRQGPTDNQAPGTSTAAPTHMEPAGSVSSEDEEEDRADVDDALEAAEAAAEAAFADEDTTP